MSLGSLPTNVTNQHSPFSKLQLSKCTQSETDSSSHGTWSWLELDGMVLSRCIGSPPLRIIGGAHLLHTARATDGHLAQSRRHAIAFKSFTTLTLSAASWVAFHSALSVSGLGTLLENIPRTFFRWKLRIYHGQQCCVCLRCCIMFCKICVRCISARLPRTRGGS